MLVKGMLSGIRIVFLLWIARISSPQQFGALALCFAAIEVLRVAGDFGAETLYVRRIAQARTSAETAQHLGDLAAFRIVAAGMAVALYAVLTVVLFDAQRGGSLELMPAALLLTSLGINYALTYYQARLRMDRAAMLLAGITAAYIAAAVALRWQPIEIQLGLLIGYEMLACVVLLADLRMINDLRVGHLAQAARGPVIGAVARASLPLAGTALLVTAYTRLDVFAVKQLVGALGLGLYGYAYRVTEPFRFVAGAIDATLYSRLAAQLGRDGPERRLMLGRLTLMVVAYATLLASAAAAAGYLLTVELYGNYGAAIPTLLALSAALCVRCISGFMSAFQYALGRYGLVFRFALLNLLLVVGTIYPLTTELGILGAALSLLFAETVNVLVQGWFFARAARQLRLQSAW